MEIECKYKYQNIEKFNGEKYCLCFNDLCKNLSFACDKNCQIFEDYKQLQQLKAENESLQSLNDFNVQKIETLQAENEKLSTQNYYFDKANLGLAEENENYLQCLDEIEEIARTLGNQNDVKHRLDDSGIQDLFKIDDDLLNEIEILRKHILQKIKEVKDN